MNSIRLTALTALTAFAALLILATDGAAQVPPGKAGVDVGKVTFEQRENGMVEITRNTDGSASERVLTPREADEHLKQKGVGNVTAGPELAHGQAYPQPRRMAPGQSGILKVMAALGGKCVVLPGSHVKLKLQPVDGLVFGTPVLQPAPRGTLEGVFQGEPVYDDFVLFDVPLQVAATVKAPKKIYLEGNLDLELHNGKTGVKMGVFSVKVGGLVPVGKPLPASNLAVPGRSATSGAVKRTAANPVAAGVNRRSPGTNSKSRSKPDPGKGASASGAGDPEVGVMADTGTAPGKDNPGAAGDSGTDPGLLDPPGAGGSSWLVYVLGGVVAVILALVLISRRK